MHVASHATDDGEHGPRITAPRPAWYGFAALALGCLAFGGLGFWTEEQYGTIVTGMRSPGYGGASWGLYIVFVVFFIGVSFAGITVAALARLFDIKVLGPVTRLAELLTLVALLAGASCVLADLGRPEAGLAKLPRMVNPSSPFFGTFTLVVSGYLFSSFVFFFLSGRADAAEASKASNGPLRVFHLLWASGFHGTPEQRHRHWRISFYLSLGILPMLVTAHSTLGFVFGIQGGRPGWFSVLQAPAFVVLAGVSGTGMLILLTLGFRWLFRLHGRIPDASIRWLGNFMWVLALVYLYFMVVEELTSTYAAPLADREIAHQIVGGRFAPVFWTTAGCLFLTFLLPFVLWLRRRGSVGWIALAGFLANVAAVLKRFLIVVPSQTHGAYVKLEAGLYVPTWVEIAVVTGLVGFACTILLVFGRVFPLVPGSHHPDPAERPPPPDRVGRRAASGLVQLAAVGLITFGLTDSFRLWSHGELDPRVPFAPVVFASGVMLLFVSAIVYELLPERRLERWEDRAVPLEIQDFSWRARKGRAGLAQAPPPAASQRLSRLASEAESAVRNGESAEAIDKLRELQRLTAQLSID